MPEQEKRRNWSAEEDIVLLKQVAADLPFQKSGQITRAWQALADTLMEEGSFTRSVDGQKVQNRFHALVQKHRDFNAESAKKSGVSEEEEKHILLDDIVPLLDEAKMSAAVKSEKEKEDKEKAEMAGSIVREKVMQSLRNRKDSDAMGGNGVGSSMRCQCKCTQRRTGAPACTCEDRK